MTRNPPFLYFSICIVFLSSLLFFYTVSVFPLNFFSSQTLKMPPKVPMNVQSFPRPPLIERTSQHLQIKWRGQLIADTKEAYWVLETYHPPSKFSLHQSQPNTNISSILSPTLLSPRPPSPNKTLYILRMERLGKILLHHLPRIGN